MDERDRDGMPADGGDGGPRLVGRDDFGAEVYVDGQGRRFRRQALFPVEVTSSLSDVDLARFVAAAAAELHGTDEAGDALAVYALAVSDLPDPVDAVGVFRRAALPAGIELPLGDPDHRAWTREDLGVFLRVGPGELAVLLEHVGPAWRDRDRFSSDDVYGLLVAGEFPEAVLVADGAHLARRADRHVLVCREEAAAALGVSDGAVAELGRRAATGEGVPQLVALQWAGVGRVDVTATRRMLDLAGGWLPFLLDCPDAGARMEICVRLTAP